MYITMYDFLIKCSELFTAFSGPQDFADRMYTKVTPLILLLSCGFVSLGMHVFHPIQCWVPAEFKDSWEEVIESYCYVENTYFVPLNEVNLPKQQDRKRTEIGYFQWVPLALLVQAGLVGAPSLIWKLLSSESGIDLAAMQQHAYQARIADKEERDKALQQVCRYLLDALYRRQRNLQSRARGWCCRFSIKPGGGTFLCWSYLAVKVLCAANCCLQFALIGWFTSSDFMMFGFHLLYGLISGNSSGQNDWKVSGLFPRQTYCDFPWRKVGTLTSDSVMCVLPMNMVLEQLYTFLWIWFALMFILIVLSLFTWLYRTCSACTRYRWTLHYLILTNSVSKAKHSSHELRRFVHECLCHDGVFLLRVISDRVGVLVTADIVARLWKRFKNRHMIVANMNGSKEADRKLCVTLPMSCTSSRADKL